MATSAADIDVDAATDILWTLNHPDVWLLLTGERGWSPEAFETWFRQTLMQQLLITSVPPVGRAGTASKRRA